MDLLLVVVVVAAAAAWKPAESPLVEGRHDSEHILHTKNVAHDPHVVIELALKNLIVHDLCLGDLDLNCSNGHS